MSTHTSVVTPSTNPRPANGKSALKASTALNGSGPITLAAAIESFFDWGSSMAGADGNIVRALKAFGSDSKPDREARSEMFKAMNCGYLVKKLDVTRDEAVVINGLSKHNPDQEQDDKHRTAEQQRVIDTCRMMKSRAMKLAGINDQTEAQRQALENAQATRDQNKREAEARESRLIKADELVNPPEDKDVFDVLAGLVSTLKSIHNKYSSKLVGDTGMAWRDWIKSAPVGTVTVTKTKGRK